MAKTETVKKPHHAITARMSFSGREQDLMTLAYRAVKREHDRVTFSGDDIDWGKFQDEYTFTSEELSNLFSLSKQGLYDAIDQSTTAVMSKVVELHLPNKKGFKKYNLIRSASFEDGLLTIKIEDELLKYFVDYSKGFSEIDLKLLLSLKGEKGYDKRILELISRFKNDKEYSVTLGEFCAKVDSHFTSYKRPQYFFESVLDAPIKRIVTASNGMWEPKSRHGKGYSVKKSGRSYKDSDVLTFKMKYNPPKAKQESQSHILDLDGMAKEIKHFIIIDEFENGLHVNGKILDDFLAMALDADAVSKSNLSQSELMAIYKDALSKTILNDAKLEKAKQ